MKRRARNGAKRPAQPTLVFEAVYTTDALAYARRRFSDTEHSNTAPMMLRSLPGIVEAALITFAAVAVGTFTASAEPKWVAYRSPTEFYSVEHPSDWRVKRDE